MTIRKLLPPLILLVLSATPLLAQETLLFNDRQQPYTEGLSFVQQRNYVTARRLFQQQRDQQPKFQRSKNNTLTSNSEYYIALSAMETGQPDAERLYLDFINNNYETPLKRVAYYDLGRLYFRQRDYSDAISWFEKVDRNDLSRKQQAEFKFQMGYCYFFKKDFDRAYGLFRDAKDYQNKYYYPANYYYGYLNYEKGNLEKALKSFEKIDDSKIYSRIIPFYVAQIHFQNGDYDKVISYVEPKISDRGIKYYDELNLTLGQAYFEKGNFAKALKYMDVYHENTNKVSKSSLYQYGYALYKNEEFIKATYQFEQLDDEDDSLGQNALYLLADCYLKTNKRDNARSAFRKASKLSHDAFIQENALFSYAKLSYASGLTNEAISSLQEFISQYPNSPNNTEAKGLLSELLLNTKDYATALEIIETIDDKTPRVRKAYQRVAHFRGVELYNDGRYDDAIDHFDISIYNPVDGEIKALSYFWKAEAFYQQRQYEKAVTTYSEFLNLIGAVKLENESWYKINAYYGSAYSYLKQQKYRGALSEFKDANWLLRQTDNSRLRIDLYPDVLLRQGDCAFLLKDYDAARKAYDEVIDKKLTGADYATYQSGLILGLQNDLQGKIDMLQQLSVNYPNSQYRDDADFEIGDTYFVLGRNQMAISTFNQLINKTTKEIFKIRARMKLAVIYYNTGRTQDAIDSYKMVLEQYPGSDYANEAFLGLKDIAINEGLSINKLLKGVDYAVEATTLDSISYLGAERKYFEADYAAAINGFNDYFGQFPDGYFSLPAHFYRGQSYYANYDYLKALPDYQYVIEAGFNRFTEQSLVKAAWILYHKKENYEKAHEYYKQLLDVATFKENLYAANLGLMRTNFKLEEYSRVSQYAEKILASEEAQPDHLTEAEFYVGKVAFEQGDWNTARVQFQKTADATTNV